MGASFAAYYYNSLPIAADFPSSEGLRGALMKNDVFLLIASYPDSLIKFRGALIDALLDHGFDVHVALPDLELESSIGKILDAKDVKIHHIPLQRVGLNPLADLHTLALLVRLMRRIRPDYVLGYTAKPVIYGVLAAWLSGVRRRFALITGLGYAFTGMATSSRMPLRTLIQWLYRFSLARAHKVFFQNPDDEALFRRLRLVSEYVPSCVLRGSGVDLEEYALAPLPVGPRFLFIGRLLGDKGIREYAQAAALVKTRFPMAQFQVVGWMDDNLDSISQSEMDAWIKAGTLEFLGKLADVRPAIENCNVYVLPSYREGTPRTVLEAMSMGRPVITTNAPGCKETVIDGGNGYLVPIQDAGAIKDAMMKFIEDPVLAVKMGSFSRRIAEQNYDVHRVNAMMLREMGIR
jgi:glycosyltransferase involved in cell wall biosynthesis